MRIITLNPASKKWGFLFGFINSFTYFCCVNPFIERKGELIALHLKKDKIASDIKKLKEDLERKLETLTEVHKNMLLDTEAKIKQFPKICDHTNEDGSLATDKEHKIIIPGIIGDIMLVKQVCTLCGGNVSEEKIEVKKSKEAESEFKTWYQIDDTETFMDTMTFDPNFVENFMGYISGSTIGLNYINNMLNNNNE